jgi:flagellar biosynthesis protein FlhB
MRQQDYLLLWSYLLFMWSYLLLWSYLLFMWSYLLFMCSYLLFICSYLIYLCLPVFKNVMFACIYVIVSFKSFTYKKQVRAHKKQIRSHKKQIRSQKQIKSHKKQIRSQKQIILLPHTWKSCFFTVLCCSRSGNISCIYILYLKLYI